MRAMRAAIVLVLLAPACTTSKVDPDANVVIAGTMVREDGTPASNASVSFWRRPDPIEGVATVFSFGVFCLTPELPSACEAAKTTSTDAQGRYRFDLKGRDTQGTGRTASTLEVTGQFGPAPEDFGGPVTSLRFIAQTEQLDIPLRAWEPSMRARVTGGMIDARWDRLTPAILPRGAGPGAAATNLRFEAAPDEVVWEQRAGGTSQRIDPRVLEDVLGTVSVAAEADDLPVAENRGTKLGFSIRSGRKPFAGPAGAPPSRGADCALGPRFRPNRTIAPCPLTDGLFGESDIALGASSAVIDLGRAMPVRLVVVRGCSDTCRMHASTDGRTWRAIGSGVTASFGLRPSGVRARYVRTQSDNIEDVTEVAVWDRPARVPDGSILVSPEEHRSATGAAPPGSGLPAPGGRPWWLFALGALLIVAIAFAAGRRTRRTAA